MKYYNPANIHLSGRQVTVIKEYSDGSRLIRFPDWNNKEIRASKKDLDGTY